MKKQLIALAIASSVALTFTSPANAQAVQDTAYSDWFMTGGVGKMVVNSHQFMTQVGVGYKQWELDLARQNKGTTSVDAEGTNYTITGTYRLESDKIKIGMFQPYAKVGLSYNTASNLVGKTNVATAVGVTIAKNWRIEYMHQSSLGIHSTDHGVDYASVTYVWRF